jgi:hypothetical protein
VVGAETVFADPWIVVPNWDKFQHYKDRDPVWIKLYMGLRNKDEWRHLTGFERGLLVSTWLEFGAANTQLRRSDVPRLTGLEPRTQHWDSLREAGFIYFSASKSAQIASPRARPRTREETETEKDLPKSLQDRAIPRRYRTGYRMVRGTHGVSYIPDPNGTDPLPTGWQG